MYILAILLLFSPFLFPFSCAIISSKGGEYYEFRQMGFFCPQQL
nr:MAG TPA: hypothetical protein [Caudoviricetes sp.]